MRQQGLYPKSEKFQYNIKSTTVMRQQGLYPKSEKFQYNTKAQQ